MAETGVLHILILLHELALINDDKKKDFVLEVGLSLNS